MAAVPVTIVSNPKNVGFPAAVNQGLRPARGEYLVLLNNDVVVTDGWLDQLIALVNAEREGTRWRACRRKGDLLSAPGRGRETLAKRWPHCDPKNWWLVARGPPPWALRELGA